METLIPKHVFTLLCEDVRKEEGGKISLIGVFGNDIGLETDTLPSGMPRLCIVTRVIGGSGKYKFVYSLENPSGKKMLQNMEQIVDIPTHSSVVHLNMQIVPFVIEEEGVCKFVMQLNEKKFYSMDFEIRLNKKKTS